MDLDDEELKATRELNKQIYLLKKAQFGKFPKGVLEEKVNKMEGNKCENVKIVENQ